jgi:hypothetical protein
MKKIFLLVTFGLALVACGEGSDDAVASLDDTTVTTADVQNLDIDNEQVLLEFAQCMRDNGVDGFPDPTTDADGNVRPFGGGGAGQDLGADRDTIEAARDACSPIIEDLALSFVRENRADIEDQLFEFAACMRDEGVEIPDPDFSNLLGGERGQGGGPFGGAIDVEDPKFQEAAETCSEVFGAGGVRLPGLGSGQGSNDNG